MLELAKLQEEVGPFATGLAVKIIESDLGGSLTDLFQQFDYQPVAAASLAQGLQSHSH